MIARKNSDFFIILSFCFSYQSIATILSLSDDNMLHWLEAIRFNYGQFVYNDFFVPWGPISGLIPYFFLKLFGSLGVSIIFLSFFYSLTLGLLIYLIVHQVTNNRNISLISSIVTLSWFGVFVGGWYVDHVSYLITLFASFIFTLKLRFTYKFFLIGAILACSILTKQTTGFISSSILFLLIIFYPLDRKIYKLFMMIIGGISILIIFSFYIFNFSNISDFVNNFFYYPIEYSKNEPNKNPIVLIKNLILPFNINILSAFKNTNKGLIIFYPVVIYIYLTYFTYFKFKIYKINNRFNFFFNFFLFTSLACGPMIGRNYTDVFWTFGAVFSLMYFLLSKENHKMFIIFKYFPIYLIFLSLITFSYPKIRDINIYYNNSSNYIYPIPLTDKSMPFIKIDDFIEADKFIKSISDKETSKFYIIDDNSLFFILTNNLNNISKNLYFDLNINIPRNKNLFKNWVKNQTIFISQLNPKYIISSLKDPIRLFRIQNNNFKPYNIDIQDLKYFDDFVRENYNLIFTNKSFEIFEIIK